MLRPLTCPLAGLTFALSFASRVLPALALAAVAFGASGCDALEDTFGDDQEVTGIVEAVGTDNVTVDATRYGVTAETEFEGFTGLADISVGDEVGIEYKDRSGERVAVEIEDASTEEDDD